MKEILSILRRDGVEAQAIDIDDDTGKRTVVMRAWGETDREAMDNLRYAMDQHVEKEMN